jgi:hypothetical protein
MEKKKAIKLSEEVPSVPKINPRTDSFFGKDVSPKKGFIV